MANSDSYMYICAHADSHKDTLLILGKAGQWYKASRTLIKSILEKQCGQRSGQFVHRFRGLIG